MRSVGVNPDDGYAPLQRGLNRVSRPAETARLFPIPDGDQKVDSVDQHIAQCGVGGIALFGAPMRSGELDHRCRPLEQILVIGTRLFGFEVASVVVTRKREQADQRKTRCERLSRHQPIGPLGDRRDQGDRPARVAGNRQDASHLMQQPLIVRIAESIWAVSDDADDESWANRSV